MDFKKGLLRARGHLVFLAAMVTAFTLVIQLENLEGATPGGSKYIGEPIDLASEPPMPSQRRLNNEQKEWAAVAWRYFQNQTSAETGLVSSVENFPSSTLWDTASYFMAIISAHRIGLIEQDEVDQRFSAALDSLEALPLFEGLVPNKTYDVNTLAMTNYANEPVERGIGWSAIDIGRLFVPFNVMAWSYPQHTEQVGRIMKKWANREVVRRGALYGARLETEEIDVVQEGRLGYEEYSAKSFALLGFDVSNALRYDDYLDYVDVFDVELPIDSRAPDFFEANAFVVSEPYVLDGLEFGFDRISREFAYRVYRAQERRFEETGILTAVSEDHLDQAPYFVYNSVYGNGELWAAMTEEGERVDEFRSLSTKASFGWHALYRTEYTQQLVEAVSTLYDAERGWYSGRYEASGEPNRSITCNTNAIVLESLAYMVDGPFLSFRQGVWEPTAFEGRVL